MLRPMSLSRSFDGPWRAGVLLALALSLSAAQAVAQDGDAQEAEIVCKPEIKAKLEAHKGFDDAVLAKGQATFLANCAVCHGLKGHGDGPGGKALKPHPRNFTKDDFKQGTSAFAIFLTASRGIPNTAMVSFEHLPEADRWALAHYIRQRLMPAARRGGEPTAAEVENTCIELSAPPKLPSISPELAIEILAEQADKRRQWRIRKYGPVLTNRGGDVELGAKVFAAKCVTCHGEAGVGNATGNRYGRFPFVHTPTAKLENGVAGGDWKTFTQRVAGTHKMLPEMTSAAFLTAKDWQSVHRYLGEKLAGKAEIKSDEPEPLLPQFTLITVTKAYELYVVGGKVFKMTRPGPTDVAAEAVAVEDFAAFREQYVPLWEGASPLPDVVPPQGIRVDGAAGLECAGRVSNSAELPAGCGLRDDKYAAAQHKMVTLFAAPAPVDTP